MLNKSKVTFLKWVVFLVDINIIIYSFFIAFIIRNSIEGIEFQPMNNIRSYLWVLLIVIPAWTSSFSMVGLYSLKQKLYILFIKTAAAISAGSIAAASFFYFIHDDSLSRAFFGIFALTTFVLSILFRLVLKLIMLLLRYNRKSYKKVIVVGTDTLALKFTDSIMAEPDLMIDIVGYIQVGERSDGKEPGISDGKKPGINDRDGFGINDGKELGTNGGKELNIIGNIEEFEEILTKYVVDEVVFAIPKSYVYNMEAYVLECESRGVTASTVCNFYNISISRAKLEYFGSLPIISFYTTSFDQVQLFFKRLIDIVGSCIGMAIAAAAFILVAPAIYLESPGPIFFRQDRVGKNGRIFRCYKFRSMYPDAEKRKEELLSQNQMSGAVFKIKDDPRITKVGKFTRAFSIDELPQFWNVLKGDMSLVGTRPPTLDEVHRYKNYHWRRLSIKPGLTGMWQISGRNGIHDFEEIVKLDTRYIDSWSIWLDLKIILKTAAIIITKAGAY